MSLHQADINARLSPFLRRKQEPRRFTEDKPARDDEVRALSEAIARVSPRDPEALAEWWVPFEIRLSEICGAMWPTEKEIRDAAAVVNKARPQPVSQAKADAAEIIARMMQAGEAVGEGWLYGAGAVELGVRRLIDRDTMQRYRSAAYFRRVDTYGEEAARAWEAERLAAHEAAKDVWRSRDEIRTARNVNIPTKNEAAA